MATSGRAEAAANEGATATIEKAEESNPTLSLLTSKEEQEKTLQESISGFVAGGSLTLTKTFVKYPLDTATVRLQMPETDYSIRDPLRLLKGSYRGVVAPLLWNVPAGAVFFGVKDAAKAAMRDSGLPRWITTSIAVAAAQCPYWLVRNPSEVVKTRQQANVDGYGEGTSTLDAFRMVFDEGMENSGTGFDAFYSGYWQNILYAYPADVIKFVCYDSITRGKKNLPPLEGAMAGAASTAVAQFVTTPLDVVRNRVMAGEMPENKKASSYIGSLVKLAEEEGIEGLFAGASPRVGKAILSGAIQFATYEETKQKLNYMFENRYGN
jgi:solute carrier family 25 S-adenosylmethionine transporter 26